MSPEEIQRYFTRSDGKYLFARWGRPIVPVVFGVEDETLKTVKGAVEAVVSLANHKMAETDPELGANLMVFFFREWGELLSVPNLDQLVSDLHPLVGRLEQADANQYRVFRFDPDGAIRACFVFVRMDAEMSKVPADTVALNQAVQMILLWSDTAFQDASPLAIASGAAVLKPEVADIIRASYDPLLPAVARDNAHSYRVFARVGPRQ